MCKSAAGLGVAGIIHRLPPPWPRHRLHHQGRAFRLKVYQAPEGGTASKGKALVNLLQLGEGEKVSATLALREFTEDSFVLMATRFGLIRKLDLASLEKIRKNDIVEKLKDY